MRWTQPRIGHCRSKVEYRRKRLISNSQGKYSWKHLGRRVSEHAQESEESMSGFVKILRSVWKYRRLKVIHRHANTKAAEIPCDNAGRLDAGQTCAKLYEHHVNKWGIRSVFEQRVVKRGGWPHTSPREPSQCPTKTAATTPDNMRKYDSLIPTNKTVLLIIAETRTQIDWCYDLDTNYCNE